VLVAQYLQGALQDPALLRLDYVSLSFPPLVVLHCGPSNSYPGTWIGHYHDTETAAIPCCYEESETRARSEKIAMLCSQGRGRDAQGDWIDLRGYLSNYFARLRHVSLLPSKSQWYLYMLGHFINRARVRGGALGRRCLHLDFRHWPYRCAYVIGLTE
jgi:hypothetical protein